MKPLNEIDTSNMGTASKKTMLREWCEPEIEGASNFVESENKNTSGVYKQADL